MPTDNQLVAHEQGHELYYLCEQYDIPKDVLEETMIACGKDGKFGRSRKKIYAALREKGYEVGRKKKSAKVENQ